MSIDEGSKAEKSERAIAVACALELQTALRERSHWASPSTKPSMISLQSDLPGSTSSPDMEVFVYWQISAIATLANYETVVVEWLSALGMHICRYTMSRFSLELSRDYSSIGKDRDQEEAAHCPIRRKRGNAVSRQS